MLASITPLGQRGRHRSWHGTAVAYAAGSTAGGALVGGLCGLAGAAFAGVLATGPARALLLAVGCTIGAVTDAHRAGRRLPGPRRQVNEDWLPTYRGWVTGLGFGVQLGAGVVTIVTSATVYLTFLFAFASGGPREGALIGATFGAARALPLLTSRRVTTPGALRRLHGRVQRLGQPVRLTAVGAQGLLAAGLGAVLLTW